MFFLLVNNTNVLSIGEYKCSFHCKYITKVPMWRLVSVLIKSTYVRCIMSENQVPMSA